MPQCSTAFKKNKSQKYEEFVKYRCINILVLIFLFADVVDVCALTAYAQSRIYLCINATFTLQYEYSGQVFCVAKAC